MSPHRADHTPLQTAHGPLFAAKRPADTVDRTFLAQSATPEDKMALIRQRGNRQGEGNLRGPTIAWKLPGGVMGTNDAPEGLA